MKRRRRGDFHLLERNQRDSVCVDGEGQRVKKGHRGQEALVIEVCVLQVQGKMET